MPSHFSHSPWTLLFLGQLCCDTTKAYNPLATDQDGDGLSVFEGDCDDNDPNIQIIDADGDGWSCYLDCDDQEANIHSKLEDANCDGFSDFPDIATGSYHTCIINDSGYAQCWGAGEWDYEDDSIHEGQSDPPISVRFTQIVASQEGTCGLDTDGDIHCWGDAYFTSWDQFTQVSIFDGNSCGISTSGVVDCDAFWSTSNPNSNLYSRIAIGDSHGCGILYNGSIDCWGDNSLGQLNAPIGTFTQIMANQDYTCALDMNNQAYCWGQHTFYNSQCTMTNDGLVQCWYNGSYRDVEFRQLSTGSNHICGVLPTSEAVCWGNSNSNNELNIPINIQGNIRYISAGNYHSCARLLDDSVQCWGDDQYGQSSLY